MKRSLSYLLPAAGALLFLMAWGGIKEIWQIRDFILPSPSQVWEAAVRERTVLFDAALTTFMGAFLGFAAAAFAGFVLSLILALSRFVRMTLYPHVLILQMIPVVVLAPVFVIWLGPGLLSVAIIAFLIGFFPIVANTTHGLISTDAHMVDLFRMSGASRYQEILWLRVPFALPSFLTGLKIAGSLAMIGAIAGEFFAGSSAGGSGGLGFMVIVYNAQLKIPALFATGLVACLCGFVFVSAVLLVNWLLLRQWHDSIPKRDV